MRLSLKSPKREYPSFRLWRMLGRSVLMLSLATTLAALLTPTFAGDTVLQDAIKTNQSSNSQAAKSQKIVNTLSDKTRQLYADYKHNLRQLNSLKLYNKNLDQLLESQKQELASYDDQLAQIDDTQRDIIPLMIKMVDTLDQFIKLDQPFLVGERTARVKTLKSLLRRSDITTSEKYRRIMEAYQVEMEYGRTIEAYRDTLVISGNKLTLNFFRLGRVALYYQTLDQQESAVWNKSTKTWDTLSSDFRLPISKGIRIARKQAAPDLLLLPVDAPEDSP